MSDMIPGFAARWQDRRPHYEVWYGKVDIAPERALWFRYTTLDGAVSQASTWAILFDQGSCRGARDDYDLAELATPNQVIVPERDDAERFASHRQVFHICEDIHLDEQNAVGRAGDIAWDLHWRDRGRRFRYLPHVFERVGLAKSTYDTCMADLRMTGTIRCGEREFHVDGVPGMVAHIQGKRIIGHDWGWSHCNCFDNAEDAVFEGLSLRALMAGRVTPKLSAFVLWLDGQQYTFRSPLGMLLNQSEYSRDRWVFSARNGDVRLSGEARSPDNVALVEYTDTDGSHLWCYNSKLSDLEVRIEDPNRGLDRTLVSSGRAAFEHVNRDAPNSTPLIA